MKKSKQFTEDLDREMAELKQKLIRRRESKQRTRSHLWQLVEKINQAYPNADGLTKKDNPQ